MLTSGEIEAVSMSMDESLKALEMRIMEDIVRRIKINGEITRSADWQITRLLQLGMSMKEIENDIKSALDFSDEEMLEMYSNIVSSGYTRDKKLYEAVGVAFIPFEQNYELQQLVSAVASQTNSTLKNITQSLGFAVRQPDGKLQFIKLAEYYQKTLDNAMLDITSGAFDYNTVLKRTVKEMTNSGLRTVPYASGYSNRVDVAARRAVMMGMSQITAKVNEANAEALDTDMFEVTYHSGARPEHQVWQGRWYTRKQLETVCGLGTVTGLCGVNCYHDYYPVIPGVSEPVYTDKELAELNAKDNTPIEYKGRKYTKYEALQKQRRLETTMRAQRQEIKLLKDGGAAEDDLINARARYRITSHEYSVFSNAMDLPQQRERVRISGDFVPKAGAKKVGSVSADERLELLEKPAFGVDKTEKSDIIEERSKKPITPITNNSIERVPKVEITGYTDEQCSLIQRQHKELLEYSRQNNDNKEVAFVLNGDLTNCREFLGEDDKLDFGTSLYGKDLFVMHNHPRNSSYSITDLIFFGNNSNVKTFTIVKNNGDIEYLTKSKDFNLQKFKLEYDRLYRKTVISGSDKEKDKFVRLLLNKTKAGVIWSERQ